MWRLKNKDQENDKKENDKEVVHDIVNETYDLERDTENSKDQKESENKQDQKGSFFDFLNSNKDEQENEDENEDKQENEVKIPDCENLLKTMRECTKKNDGTFNCKKEIDEWEKNCKKSWF